MLRHKVQINAVKYTPMNDQLVHISLTSLYQKSRPFYEQETYIFSFLKRSSFIVLPKVQNCAQIVTGELRNVASTPFDLRVPKVLGTALFHLPKKGGGIIV